MELASRNDGYGCEVWVCEDFDDLPLEVIRAVVWCHRHGRNPRFDAVWN